MGKEKYDREELIRLLIHEGKSYKEVAAIYANGCTGEARWENNGLYIPGFEKL